MYSAVQSVEKERLNENGSFSDAHCHLNLFEKPDEIVRLALSEGIEIIVTAGGSIRDSIETSKIAKENVFGVVGIDPEHIHESEHVKDIEGLIESNKNVVGIGEIGLDRKAIKSEKDFDAQKELFIKQLEIAEKLNLPVVIHSRESLDDLLDILKDFKLRAMFHFFEGDERYAERMKGYTISIPPVETSKRRRAIKAFKIDSIVLETDSPIVGKDPSDAKISAEIVAREKGLSIEEVAAATLENLRKFFYI